MIAQQATQCPWRRPVETVPEPKNYGRTGVKARSREFKCDTIVKMQNAKPLIELVEKRLAQIWPACWLSFFVWLLLVFPVKGAEEPLVLPAWPGAVPGDY